MSEKATPKGVHDALVIAGATPELVARIQSAHPRDVAWCRQFIAYLNSAVGTYVPAQITKTKAQHFKKSGDFLFDEGIFFHVDKSVWDMPQIRTNTMRAKSTTFQSYDVAIEAGMDDTILDLGISCQPDLCICSIFSLISQKGREPKGPLLPEGNSNWFIPISGTTPVCLRLINELGLWGMHVYSREQMYGQYFKVGDRIHALAW